MLCACCASVESQLIHSKSGKGAFIMANEKEIVKKDSSLGAIRIADEVVSIIAGLAATEVDGIAGMSGGIAYVLDEDWDFYQRVNKDMVSLEPVEHKYDVSLLKDLIREHVELTGSPRGKEILDNFGEYLPKFKKVLPHDYDKMLRLIAQMEEKGEDSEQAQIEAFYAMKSAK